MGDVRQNHIFANIEERRIARPPNRPDVLAVERGLGHEIRPGVGEVEILGVPLLPDVDAVSDGMDVVGAVFVTKAADELPVRIKHHDAVLMT